MQMQSNTSMSTTGSTATDANTLITDGESIRFEGCIGCPDLGVTCCGGNLGLLTIPELRIFANKWRSYYKLSVSKCSAAWDMAEGTVSRFLSSSDPDFRYATIQSIITGIVWYGQPADHQRSYRPCPYTTEKVQEKLAHYEKQLLEKTEENAELVSKKLERANEYTERMAEQRENYEKHLAEKQETIVFLRELAAKRQRDLEKSEAVSADYLARIDAKNDKLEKMGEELRLANAEIIKVYASHSAEVSSLVDRMARIAETRCPRDLR